jgi:cell division protein FtsB
MSTIYLAGGGIAIIALVLWFAMRSAKKQGAAEQQAKSERTRADAESQIHEIQSERRDTPETIKRLDDGTF